MDELSEKDLFQIEEKEILLELNILRIQHQLIPLIRKKNENLNFQRRAVVREDDEVSLKDLKHLITEEETIIKEIGEYEEESLRTLKEVKDLISKEENLIKY